MGLFKRVGISKKSCHRKAEQKCRKLTPTFRAFRFSDLKNFDAFWTTHMAINYLKKLSLKGGMKSFKKEEHV